MNILQITSTFFPVKGGQEKVVYEISKRLVKKGHNVTILTTDLLCEEKLPEKEKLEGMEIIRLKNNLYLGSYGFCSKAKKWLRENYKNYDVMHCHGYNRFLSEFSLYYLKNKIPSVFSAHGFIHTKKNYIFKKIHDLSVGKFVRYADICTALTQLDFEDYKKLGVKKQKIIEIANGVDIDKFKNVTKKEIMDFKKRDNLDKNTLLYVGRIHKSKGLQYVIEAIKDLDCKLFIVGNDVGFKEELLEKINELNIKEKIIFGGNLSDEDVIRAYCSCDIFVLFSEWEGFGIVVIEAMAAGKPVIASDRGALPFIIKDKENGLIVGFKDTNILKEKINEILRDKRKAKKIGSKAKIMAKNYKWDNIVGRYEQIYKDLK